MVGMHRNAFADITGKTGRKEKSNSQREEKVSFLQSCGGSVRGGIPSTHLPRPLPAPGRRRGRGRDWLADRRRIDEKSAVKDEILTGARKWGEEKRPSSSFAPLRRKEIPLSARLIGFLWPMVHHRPGLFSPFAQDQRARAWLYRLLLFSGKKVF